MLRNIQAGAGGCWSSYPRRRRTRTEPSRGRGETIGKRARLRSWWAKALGGSSPSARIDQLPLRTDDPIKDRDAVSVRHREVAVVRLGNPDAEQLAMVDED